MKLFGWLKWLLNLFSRDSSLLDKVERRCLFDMLQRLPLKQLYRVDQESIAQAKPEIVSMQLELCQRKDAISIYLATNVPTDAKIRQHRIGDENYIDLRELSRSTCDRLVKLFPRITKLTIAHISWSLNDQVLFDKFIYLLNKWSPNLQMLKMDIKIMPNFTFPLIGEHYVRLWHQIESMPSLKSLMMFTNAHHSRRVISAQVNLSFVSQLNQLCIRMYGDFVSELADALMANVSASSNLKTIYISSPIDQVDQLDKFLEMKPHLANRFFRLALFCHHVNMARLNAFCNRFNSLRSLFIDPGPLPITEVVRQLRSMKQLDTLRITIDFVNNPLTENCLDEHYALKSVKNLNLCLILKAHDELASSHIEKLLPNLKHATVVVFSCVECQYDKMNSNEFIRSKKANRRQCVAAVVSNSMWKQFAHLRQVLLDDASKFIYFSN